MGRNCELYCKVTGNPLPVVRWFKDDVCVDSWPNYEITFNNGDARLLIEEATMDVGAMYACTAVNPLGSDTTTAQVAVEGKLVSTLLLLPSSLPPSHSLSPTLFTRITRIFRYSLTKNANCDSQLRFEFEIGASYTRPSTRKTNASTRI